MVSERGERTLVSDHIQRFTSIKILGQLYRSAAATSLRGSYIQAIFPKSGDANEPIESDEIEYRYGQIQYFFVHKVQVLDYETREPRLTAHVFAFVRWFAKSYPGFISFAPFGLAVCKDETRYLPLREDCILPVHRIHSPITVSRHLENTLVVVPLLRRTIG